MTISYAQAPYPVRDDLPAAHQRFWRRLAAPGNWWTGAERVAIAREARHARACELCRRRKQALSPYHLEGVHDRAGGELPEVAVDAVHRIVTDASRLKREWLEQSIRDGLSVERYVELLGTVVALVSIDSFCRALGVPEHPLPMAQPGSPSGYRPASARQEEAWVPVVPEDNAGIPEADLWKPRRTGWVIRAMSLVPDEVRTLGDLSDAHYLPMDDVPNPQASRGSLSRPQMELIAGRVSALNGCFYWTTAHATLLRASGADQEGTLDLHAVTESGRSSGVPHGEVLIAFAEAVFGGDAAVIALARQSVIDAMGVEAMIDAAAVASNFERMVRIADATGIPLGERLESFARGVIDELGLERLQGEYVR